MRLAIVVCVALFVLFPIPVQAARIVVLDVEPGETDQAFAANVQDFLVQEVARFRGDSVIGGSDLAALMEVERERLMLDAASQRGIANIAESWDADFIISGALTVQDGTTVLTLRLIDARSVRVAGRSAVELTGRGTAIIPQIASGVRQLFGAHGTLQLLRQVSGATVYINGRRAGEMPLSRIRIPTAGTYQISVHHDEYPSYERTINVEAGAVTRVTLDMLSYADMQDRVRARKRWGWTLLGSGAAVLGVGAWQYNQATAMRREYEAAHATPVLQSQALEQRERLVRMNESANSRYLGAQVTAGAGLGVAAMGTFMLVYNPWAEQLRTLAALEPAMYFIAGTPALTLSHRW
jgi:hypothetical protein